MRNAKIIGLLTVAAVALMAYVAPASATTGTDSSGGSKVEVGDSFLAFNTGNVTLGAGGHPSITCKKSTVGGTVGNAGSGSTTMGGNVSTLTFEECGSNTITVVNKGILEVHTDSASADGNGVFTSSGAEITMLSHNILGTVHCIYLTSETYLGTLDGSRNTGGKATLTVGSGPMPNKVTDFACSDTAEWAAEYTFSTPAYLDID